MIACLTVNTRVTVSMLAITDTYSFRRNGGYYDAGRHE